MAALGGREADIPIDTLIQLANAIRPAHMKRTVCLLKQLFAPRRSDVKGSTGQFGINAHGWSPAALLPSVLSPRQLLVIALAPQLFRLILAVVKWASAVASAGGATGSSSRAGAAGQWRARSEEWRRRWHAVLMAADDALPDATAVAAGVLLAFLRR